MNSPDQDTLLRAIEDARRIPGEYVEPRPRDAAHSRTVTGRVRQRKRGACTGPLEWTECCASSKELQLGAFREAQNG